MQLVFIKSFSDNIFHKWVFCIQTGFYPSKTYIIAFLIFAYYIQKIIIHYKINNAINYIVARGCGPFIAKLTLLVGT